MDRPGGPADLGNGRRRSPAPSPVRRISLSKHQPKQYRSRRSLRPLRRHAGNRRPACLVHITSFVGFGITRLLDFDLIARFKQINTKKLYVPGRGDQYAYPALAPTLTRPVRWGVIENNYDLMMK